MTAVWPVQPVTAVWPHLSSPSCTSRRLIGVANPARAIRRCATVLPLPSPFQPLSLERRQVVDVLVTRYLFTLSYSLVPGTDRCMKSDQAVTDRAVAQYRGARNQKPGGRNLCGAMVQLHPAHIMVGVVLHTLCEDGHSRRPVASPPSSRPPCSPTVHLLRRSRSQHRAGAPAPIAAPRWQGGLRSAYQPRLARRKLLSSARVTSPDVLRALLRAHRLLAAEIFRVRSGSGALQPTFRPRELKERRARPRRAAVMYAMAGGAGSSCRS